MLHARVTDREVRSIRAAADRAQTSMSEFVRKAVQLALAVQASRRAGGAAETPQVDREPHPDGAAQKAASAENTAALAP
jgi:Arc/MetJ-type ribon-helix-helix transcriptional regulator